MIGRRELLAGFLAVTAMTPVEASIMRLRLRGKIAAAPTSPDFSNLPAVTYDQGMGATDSNGIVTSFPLRTTGTAKRVWANTAIGSDSYNGLSPYPGYRLNGTASNFQYGATGQGAADSAYGPKATYAGAVGAVSVTYTSPQGNQYFFAEGQTFSVDAGIGDNYMGFSAAYPTCFQSYDPADPLNEAKHGRAGTGTRGARPIWTTGTASWPAATRGDAREYGNWAFRGLQLVNTTTLQALLWFPYATSNLLFENLVLDRVQISVDNSNPNTGFKTSTNTIIRRCVSYGQYDTAAAHACGVHSANRDLTVEDCVFWHNGWKVGGSRDDAVSAGGPDIYKHSLYLANGSGTTSIVRRNICIDGSAAGLSMRGNHVAHHNVIIDCPTPYASGGGAADDYDNPSGVLQQGYCNFTFGGDDINSSSPRGWGFSSSDGTVDSFHNYNLYANNPKYGGSTNSFLSMSPNPGAGHTPWNNYMNFTGNRAYGFAPSAKRLVLSAYSPATVANAVVLTDSDNVLSSTSPMTNAQIYTALGYTDKAAAVAAMIADPMQNWAYRLLQIAATGFSFDFNRTLA